MGSTVRSAVLAWTAFAAHVAAGVAVARRAAWIPANVVPRVLPALNLAIAACVLAYWANEWYGYLTKGITWYGSDQVIPIYAAVVAVASVVALTGRHDGRVVQSIGWIAFVVHSATLLLLALYVTFVRFDRMF